MYTQSRSYHSQHRKLRFRVRRSLHRKLICREYTILSIETYVQSIRIHPKLLPPNTYALHTLILWTLVVGIPGLPLLVDIDREVDAPVSEVYERNPERNPSASLRHRLSLATHKSWDPDPQSEESAEDRGEVRI